MATSLSTPEGDALRSTVTDYGAPPFNLDTITSAQIQTYANNNITSLATAAVAWVTLAKVVLWLYRRVKTDEAKYEARLTALERRS